MDARRLARLGLLSAGGVAAYVFESLLPVPLPWARVGLSNIFVLITLFGFGFRDAFLVAAVRVIAGNLLLGILMSPAFVLSIGGSMVALAVMGLAKWKFVPPLSIVGTSCLGAVVNNVVQLLLFMILLSGAEVVGSMLGGFILLGVGVGFVTGFIAARILSKVVLARNQALG
jgi:heptaprenyl diphosphate synthase